MDEKYFDNWILVSVWDVIPEQFNLFEVMNPYLKWCEENLGPPRDSDSKSWRGIIIRAAFGIRYVLENQRMR